MKISLCALLFACALIASPAYAQTSAPPSGGNSGGSPAAATTSGSSVHHPGPCHDDVQKFCSGVQKGGGRILDCLKQNEGKLSPRCEAAMKRHASGGQQPAPAQGMPAPSTGTPPAK
jgi:hypothetical protein